MAILGVFGLWFPVLGALLPIVALVLGLVALSGDKKAGRGKGVSISAIVVAAIGLAVALIWSVAAIFFIANNSDTITSAFDCATQADQNNWTQQQLDDCMNNIP